MSNIYVSTTYKGDESSAYTAAEELRRVGIRNIELGSNHAQIKSREINLLFRERRVNYIIHNYFPPANRNFILNIASQKNTMRGKSIAFIKSSIDWCHKKKIKYYTIHPGFFAEAVGQVGHKGGNRNFDLEFSARPAKSKDRKRKIDQTIKIIRDLYNFSKNKVELLVENPGSKTSKGATLFDSLQELELLKKSIGSELKFNFNLAHAVLSGIDIRQREIFQYIYKNSPFFEISEIDGIYDSHLPVTPKNGAIGKLFSLYRGKFKQKNIILEYRNLPFDEVLKSYGNIKVFLE